MWPPKGPGELPKGDFVFVDASVEAIEPNVIKFGIGIDVSLVAGSYKGVVSNKAGDGRAGDILNKEFRFGHLGGFKGTQNRRC